ncbi:MAG TPA: error-prone DNA polymerase [bacterium]|nr:error-prone DNA polymerase [bacterium]
MRYTPLWCKTNFSFLEGASSPEALIKAAAAHGLTELAVTDRDGVYGVVEAHLAARDRGIRVITGAQVTVTAALPPKRPTAEPVRPARPFRPGESALVLLAADRGGYANLCRLLTVGRLRSPKGESRVTWREVAEHAGGLVALWGGDASLLTAEGPDPDGVSHVLREGFGDRLYAMAARHRRDLEVPGERRLRARAAQYGLPVVAVHEVLYETPGRRPLQDVLTCIRHGVELSAAGTLIKPNAEHALKDPAAFEALFADDPDAVRRTCEVADRCTFALTELRYRYPLERLPDGATSSGWLRTLTFAGAAERYGGSVPPEVAAQLDRELAVIGELDYGGYFLTMHEIVRYCRAHGILCQGRGSAANSAVCYCLGITAVNPVRTDLLFERFLSRERAEPPDIDLDVQHNRREEVIQWIYETYGRERAGMVANFIRYRFRSAVRDAGKALGLPLVVLDRVAKLVWHEDEVTSKLLCDAGLDPERPLHQHLGRLAGEMQDLPRHLSIHPGGFLLGHEPVPTLVPIENATMPDRTVIQWDKDSVEGIGLFKVDVLALGSLSHLDIAFRLLDDRGIRAPDGRPVSMATIPDGDRATFEMMSRADTIGVFQVESRAQMSMLPRLRPKTYDDLVVQISIVRPGPIVGGMVHPYLRRRAGEEPVEYPHPSLEPVLRKTLGVPIFQEQVIRIAMVAADYTPGEADQLRRDMAAWRRSGRLERHHDRLVSAMTAKGVKQEMAERVFDQIKGFGEYGFPQSHGASFALIAYASGYLKCHHHAEFTCGLLNAQPMGFYAPSTIVDDAKRHGVEVRPIDVTVSDWDCTLEPVSGAPPAAAGLLDVTRLCTVADSGPRRWSRAVRMGLRYVKGLAQDGGRRLVQVRSERPFQSLEDLVRRTRLDAGSLVELAESGAFDALGVDRRTALWHVRALARRRDIVLPVHVREPSPLFDGLSAYEEIAWDYRASAHSTRGHPLSTMRAALQAANLPDARAVLAMRDGAHVRYAGVVICRQTPGTASGVTFMTLEDESGFVNLVIWPAVMDEFAQLVRTAVFLGVTGRIQRQHEIVHVIAQQFWRPQLGPRLPDVASRNFR